VQLHLERVIMNYHWIRENRHIVSLVAATLISLACGTNVRIRNVIGSIC
jgi:hypothetical protein